MQRPQTLSEIEDQVRESQRGLDALQHGIAMTGETPFYAEAQRRRHRRLASLLRRSRKALANGLPLPIDGAAAA